MKVGILSFQGSFLDHSKSIKAINAKPILIKNKSDIHELDALILPGGESTAMKKINEYSDIFHALDKFIKSSIPPV